jgi:carboxylesterase
MIDPIRPIARDGVAPAVVLIHGFTGTPWELEPLVDAVSAEGFAVRAPLLPGHGETPACLSRARWTDWQSHVERVVDAELDRFGSVIVLGFSLGSLLALAVGGARQHRGVLAIGALGTAIALPTLEDRVLRVSEALGPLLPHVHIPKLRGSDVRDPDAKRTNPAYPTQPLRAAREILRGQRAAREAAPRLTVPLLVVHGRADDTTPLRASLELVALAERADVELRVLPRSAHMLGRDVEAREVSDAVVSFIGRVSRRHRHSPAHALRSQDEHT